MVKTAASHAVNIGSNPVWVTKSFEKAVDKEPKRCYTKAVRKRKLFDIEKMGQTHPNEFVLIVMRVHLFPSRTQKLSSCTPTILGG